MTTREDIREDAIVMTKNQLWLEGIRDEQRLAVRAIQIVDQIFSHQSSQGVVIKVDRKLPKCVLYTEQMIMEYDCPLRRAGWGAFESLV